MKPFYDSPSGEEEELLVRTEQPSAKDDLWKLDPPKEYWVWTNGNSDPSGTFGEEHVGIWKRMYMRVNETLLVFQEEKREKKRREKEAERAAMSPFSRWASDAVTGMKGAFGSAARAIGGVFSHPKPRVKPEGTPAEWGYHDIVSWQQGDAENNTVKSVVPIHP